MAGFQLGSVVAKVTADISDFKKGMEQVRDETAQASNKISQFGGVIKGALIAGSVAAAAGIAVLGRSALDAAADFEQTRIAFETMLGSEAKAQKLLKDLQTFAKKTPFNLVELQEGTKRLLAYGIEGEKVIDTMRVLGDITSGVGRDKMPQLILAFGQVKAAGHLTGMELRQFSETGVPLLDTLAKQFNVSTGEMTEMISRGEVGFPAVQQALSSLTGEGGKFFNLMDKQAKTFTGSMSNLQDSWNQLLILLGTVFIPLATQIVQSLTSLLTPIMSVVAGNQSLQQAFGLSGQQAQTFQNILNEFKSFLFDTFLPAVQVVVTFLREQWTLHKDEFNAVWQVIWGIIQVAWSLIYGLIKTGLEILSGDWQGAWNAIRQMTNNAVNGIKDILNGALGFIRTWGGGVLDLIVSPFRNAFNQAREIVENIKNLMNANKKNSPSMVDIVKRGVQDLNTAWEGLKMPVPILAHAPNISPQTGGGSIANIVNQIDLSGAIISDDLTAMRAGEKIGDAIINRLKNNVRF